VQGRTALHDAKERGRKSSIASADRSAGIGSATDENRLSPRIDVEVPIGRWVDYLLTRGDIDPSRIALYGDGLGGSHATRIASHDLRFAAAVCDGGLWDRHERLFAMRRIGRDEATAGGRAWTTEGEHFATTVKCPALMTIGQHDYIAVEHAIDVHETGKRSGMPLALKVLSSEETAASPGHMDNPTLAREFVFDWIREKLKVDGAVSAGNRFAEPPGCAPVSN